MSAPDTTQRLAEALRRIHTGLDWAVSAVGEAADGSFLTLWSPLTEMRAGVKALIELADELGADVAERQP
ncbi:MAG: hypothetical protein ACREEW_13960 [Caulobacteraceae bacterium]